MSAYTTLFIPRAKAESLLISQLVRIIHELPSMSDEDVEDMLDELVSDTDDYLLNNFKIQD